MLNEKEAEKFLNDWDYLKWEFIQANLHWYIIIIWMFFCGLAIGHYYDDWLWFLWE